MQQSHPSLWDPDPDPTPKPVHDQWVRMRVLITVKAAPTPSGAYGETVCVAGLRLDLGAQCWVRLYPINFRALDGNNQFRKYEIVNLRVKPSRTDRRHESWRPDLSSVSREKYIGPWNRRRQVVDPHIRRTMCELLRDIRDDPPARSLAVVPVRDVTSLEIVRHPGWTSEQQAKVDRAASAIDMFSGPTTPLQAPRFHARFRYRCPTTGCNGHRQGLLDWELAALQYRFANADDAELEAIIRQKFLDEKVKPGRDLAFYVGNQAKREHVFSVLGVYNPPH